MEYIIARASQQNALNKIRLALLDWDPMHLFDMGMGGLEEYDEFIVPITKLMKKSKSVEELSKELLKLSKQMDDVETSLEDIAPIAERLFEIQID